MSPLAELDSARIPAEENEMSRRYLNIISRWVPMAMATYQEWPVRPNCGHFFGGVRYYGMETSNAIIALASAISSREFDPKLAGCSRDELASTVLRGLRYLLFTHDTGPADCVRPNDTWFRPELANTKWGERGKGFFKEAVCAITISGMIVAASVIRDMLTDEELSMLGAVAGDWLDRFRDVEPKSGVYENTQTEENAWVALGLTSCAALLPGRDDSDKLASRAKLWMFRTSTVPQDQQNTTLFRDLSGAEIPQQGGEVRQVNQWCGRTFTTLPDFTAENHGFVHPTYMSSAVALSGIAMNVMRLFGRDIPPQILWRRREVAGIHNRWCDRLGYPHSPQGMDWPYLRFSWPALVHAAANCYLGDADAAFLERRALEVMEQSSLAHHGAMVPQEAKDHARIAWGQMTVREEAIASAAEAYLCHRFNGPGVEPPTEEDFRWHVQGAHVYHSGGLVLHNHDRGITSFSWRNRTMILPAARDGIKFIGHAPNSVLGTYKVAEKGDSENNRKLVIREFPDRVCTLMIQDLAGDSIRRHVFFCSLPNGKGVSYEIAYALEDVTVEQCELGYLQIMNDGFFGDRGIQSSRKLYWPANEREFRGYISGNADDDATCDLSGCAWVNVDDTMGFRFCGTGSPVYINRHSYEHFHAVYDELILGRHPDSQRFRVGDKIAELALLWCPEQDHQGTQAEKLDILETPEDIFAARVGGWLCACNFGEKQANLEGVTLEPMEPRLAMLT